MVTSLLLALAGGLHSAHLAPVTGNMEWEEMPHVQKQLPGWHPKLQFSRESTFFYLTPDFVAEGKYFVQGSHYEFHPLMAIQLENSDIDKLAPEMGAQGQKFREAYARSMANFSADYDERTGDLQLNYKVGPNIKMFDLYQFTDGDDKLGSLVAPEDRFLVGLWYSPEPYPEKLDARTRYKIGGLEGLQRFAREAMESDADHFYLIDLRVDKSYRLGGTIGVWRRSGSTLTLLGGGDEIDLTISSDGRRLLSGGKTLVTRG